MSEVTIRPVERDAFSRLWPILEPVVREGTTYPLPTDLSAANAEAYWFAPGNHVFVAAIDDAIVVPIICVLISAAAARMWRMPAS